MYTFRSNIVNPISFQKCKDYLLTADWQKKIIDDGYHNYGGFSKLLKTENGKVINTASYCHRDNMLKEIDNQFTEILNTKVQSHYINILPMCEIGEHFDIYDSEDHTVGNSSGKYCNTSILHPLFGDILIESDGKKRWLENNKFTVIDTSKLHNGWNKSKKLVWCTSSLVYGKTYTEVKNILNETDKKY